jgi:hypothetical protein
MIHEWEELLNVNGFPGDRLEEIKERAVLTVPSRMKETMKSTYLRHFPGQPRGRKTAK